MSEPKKSSALLFWLGCATVAFVVMLVAVGGIMWWMLRRESATTRANQAPPVGWRDSLRARYRLPPEVTQLALPRTEDGDAAELLGIGVLGGPDSVARLRMLASNHVLNNTPRTAQDAATMRATFADSMIDRFVRAARQRRYEVRPPEGDSGGEDLYFPLGPGPRIRNLSGVGRASTGLALRIRARLERRDFALARAEIGAVFGVGELMWRNETRYWGLAVARSLLRDGARELKRYAELTRDTVAAAQASAIEAWSSSRRRAPFYGIFAFPDTAVAIAADTSLPRGLRAEAIVGGVQGAALSPLSRMIWGPPHWALRAVRALESDADPYVARAALIGDSTLTKLDRMGMYGRAKLLLRLAREH